MFAYSLFLAPTFHRRSKVHHQKQNNIDFPSNDELFFGRTHAEKHPNVDTPPRIYTGSASHPPGNHQQRGASTASVIVFAFALSGILLVFLLFYFLAKVCSPNEEDLKEQQSESIVSHGLEAIKLFIFTGKRFNKTHDDKKNGFRR